MKDNYADVLESYMIAEEGIIKDVWDNTPTGNKAVLGIAGASMIGTAALSLYLRFQRRKDSKKQVNTSSSSWDIKRDKNKGYFENTQKVIAKMQEECPEVLEKELLLRKTELKKMAMIVNQVGSKYKKFPGIAIYSKYIPEYLKNPESAEVDGHDIYCDFLTSILPSASPKIYNIHYDGGDPEWCWKSDYNIATYGYDIHTWGEAKYGDKYRNNEISVRDYEYTQEFYEVLIAISKDIENKCKGFKTFQSVACGGDWDDGSYNILLKPSDEFLRVAKTYGYFE